MVNPHDGMAEATINIIYIVASSFLANGFSPRKAKNGLSRHVITKNKNRAAPAEKSAAMGEPLRTRTP